MNDNAEYRAVAAAAGADGFVNKLGCDDELPALLATLLRIPQRLREQEQSMLQYFLQAYHQGYRDGLYGRAASPVVPAMFDDQRTDRVHQSELTSRPAYHAGFRAGCTDRTTLSQTGPTSVQPVSTHLTMGDEADTMCTDYVKAAEFLHRVLQDVSAILQREQQNAEALVIARRRLQTVVTQMEPLGEDPGKAWPSLTMQQRWGYLRLVSCLGTATHLLRQASLDATHTADAVPAMRRNSYSS